MDAASGLDSGHGRAVSPHALYRELLEIAQNKAAAGSRYAETSAAASTNIHALLVEDNPVNRMVATEYLKRAGCDVDVAHDGVEAVARCRRIDYDIVFMDCQMPEMDGFEATRMIRGERPASSRWIPIVALTANAMDSDHDECINAGMDDFLIKPANQAVFIEALRRWTGPGGRGHRHAAGESGGSVALRSAT